MCVENKNVSPKEIIENIWKKLQKFGRFKITLLPWQQQYLTIFLVSCKPYYWRNVVGEFRDHILQGPLLRSIIKEVMDDRFFSWAAKRISWTHQSSLFITHGLFHNFTLSTRRSSTNRSICLGGRVYRKSSVFIITASKTFKSTRTRWPPDLDISKKCGCFIQVSKRHIKQVVSWTWLTCILENGKRNTLIKAKTCFRYQFTFETNITDARSVIASKVAEEVVVERYVKPVILELFLGFIV